MSPDPTVVRSLKKNSFRMLILNIVGRSDCAAVGRAAAEGVRTGLRDLSLHRHQHLRDHRLEGLLTSHRQHRQR